MEPLITTATPAREGFLHALNATLPADFDPFFAVMGVKRRDWSQPVQQPKEKQ